jgi:hypothetical protein
MSEFTDRLRRMYQSGDVNESLVLTAALEIERLTAELAQAKEQLAARNSLIDRLIKVIEHAELEDSYGPLGIEARELRCRAQERKNSK